MRGAHFTEFAQRVTVVDNIQKRSDQDAKGKRSSKRTNEPGGIALRNK